ncbi:MAG TPA: hypothetical protein PKH58_08220 [Paludibacteraceae bacterium]|nr:hypothetical protein [Paludibacteraceae bacterium]HPT43623.1 hypothetical protein [Paludibacteraceae bacterium]
MKVWLKEIAFVLLSVSVFSGCSIITNGINYKRDKLMDRTRYTLQQSFITNERHEQDYQQQISLLKEIDENGQSTYTMYDIISIPLKSFDISNEMYIIIDKEPIPLPLTLKERLYDNDLKNGINFPEQSTDTAQNFSISSTKVTRMIHPLDDELIEKISRAKAVYLRYYVGPEMITSEIKGTKLYSLKKLISRKYK